MTETCLRRHSVKLVLWFVVVMSFGPSFADAATYSLPYGPLPSGCANSGNIVSCGAVNLSWDDIINVNDNNLILNISGNASFQNAQINFNENADRLTINISGNLTTGSSFRASAMINVSGSAILGSSNQFAGSLTANSIQTGSSTIINADLNGGNITIGSGNTVTGDLSGSVITINSSNSTVNGSIKATSNVHISSGSTVNGDIAGHHITTTSAVSLNGNINASGDFTLASGSSVTGDVSAENVTLLSSNATIGGNAVADEVITLNWNGTVSGDAAAPHIISNGGNVQGETYCDTSGGSTPVVCSKDERGLLLGKVASTSAAVVGDIITFAISADNPLGEPLTGLVIEDVLPAGMAYITHVATLGSVNTSGQTLIWSVSSLPAESSATLTLAVSLSQQGTLTNTVTSPGAVSADATVLVLASAVTHFRMDEPVGSWAGAAGEVIDSGGTALHGRRLLSSSPTTTNAVAPSPTIISQHPTVIGGFCNVANFDGKAIVEVADSPLFDYTTQLSASAWIYPTAYPSELSSILSNDVNYEFHINSSGRLYWWWQASTLTSATTIPLNQWTHIAITFDSRSGVRRQRIYINGVQDSNTNNWQGTLSPNNCNFYIGGDIATGAACSIIPARNFRGMIDEVKLYSFELSEEEVLADMRLGRSCSGTFDHIRIEHNGVGSICAPERVTLKACLNPECTVLYPGTVTVNLLPTGWVGGGTSSFSGGIASRQISRGTAGGIVLGTSSVSPVPASGTRCFRGATETCQFNFVEASCAFDAVEPGAAPQTPIYTKLSGVPFSVDLLALLGPTVINPEYVGTVTVDLVDSTGAACPTGAGLSAATAVAFSAEAAGRKTLSFSYPAAARNVRVRMTVAESSPACSSDNFAIRPTGFTVSSVDATNPAKTGLPIIAAGAPFSLAVTTVAGYDGVPLINQGLLVGTSHAGDLTGEFAAAINGIATGSSFSYSDVGHFGLLENAVYDNSFTAVDQPDDCLNGFLNVYTSGRYGCSIGSGAVPLVAGSSGFGRFIPHHFEVSTNAPVFDTACGSFTYSGQPFHYSIAPVMTVSARNAAGGLTQNYTGDYWKLTNASLGVKSYSVLGGSLDTGLVPSPDPVITDSGDGTGTLSFSSGGGMAVGRNIPVPLFDAEIRLQIPVIDSDGVSYPGNPAYFGQTVSGQGISFSNGKQIRYGRMLLQNAYGPETQPLIIPVRTEYYTGSVFTLNEADNCTAYASGSLSLSMNLANSGTTTASGNGTLVSGVGNHLILTAPGVGHEGSVDLTLDLSLATGLNLEWLRPEGVDPTAKATFGIFRGNPRLIYMRESVW